MRSVDHVLDGLQPANRTATRVLLEMVRAAIESVEPAALVTRALNQAEGELESVLREASSIIILAVGKAAIGMAWGAEKALGRSISAGLVISDQEDEVPPWAELVVAGHPLPDDRSATAAHAALDLVTTVADDDLLLALVSGGGSSLMEVSHEALDPADVRRLMDQLIRSGAPIEAINALRSRLSRVKAGRLAARCSGRLATLIISDVAGSDPRHIASGPTIAAHPPPDQEHDLFEAYDLRGPAADRVRSFVEGLGAEPPPPQAFVAQVIADGRTAGEAALASAHRQRYRATYMTDAMSGDACLAARQALSATPDGSLGVYTGETTVAVVGSGQGGRNQQAALAVAIEIKGTSHRFLACGTDGIDGPTDAAGAFVDGTTVTDIDVARRHLQTCNAYPYLDRARSLLRTGKTGTNVGDLWIVDKTG